MKRTATILILSIFSAACGSSAGTTVPSTTVVRTVPTTVSETTSTSTAVTTSSVGRGSDATAATCDAIKVALFDLDSELQTAIGGLDLDASSELSDQEAAALFFAPIARFYETISAISATAPAEVSQELGDVASGVVPLADAVAAGRAEDLEDMIDPQGDVVFTGAETVDTWVSENCDIETSLDPAVLVADSLLAAMFSGLGDALSGLGSELGDAGDLTQAGESNMAFGDDPELDTLWTRCEADDDEACDELYWQTFGMYELFAQTCGGRAPYHSDGGGSCETRMDTGGPSEYGEDFYLDSLWDACSDGDAFSCDILTGSAPIGSAYQDHGARCGGLRDLPADRPCDATDEPYIYGDDSELDASWEACSSGAADACRDLWFDSPVGSAYESMGDACGALLDRGQTCEHVSELLGVPSA